MYNIRIENDEKIIFQLVISCGVAMETAWLMKLVIATPANVTRGLPIC